MEKILRIDNLRLSFYGASGRVEAVRGVSFDIGCGETVALVGESGCGKTALCRAIMMLHAKHAVIEDGGIVLCGKDVTRMTERELRGIRGKAAAMIFQDPSASLDPTMSIGKQIIVPLMLHGCGKRKRCLAGQAKIHLRANAKKTEMHKTALELLQFVGIEDAKRCMKLYPHQLSGGMKQRAAAAIALAAKPKLLIADEPTTALDETSRDMVMELLKRICKGGKLSENGENAQTSLLFVTHDLSLAKKLADRIIVMKDGVVTEIGTPQKIFSAPEHDYTKHLLECLKIPKSQEVRAISEECLLKISGLTQKYNQGHGHTKTVLDNFSMEIRKGEIVGIAGDSGCGKSTLARCIMGVQSYSAGTIEFLEGCEKQMVFQDSASAFNPRMRLFDIIAEPLVIRQKNGKSNMSRSEIKNIVLKAMSDVGLKRELAGRFPYDVSGGQRQRAAIARALVTAPDFIIADEPVTALDVSLQAQIMLLFKRLHQERGLTLMIISHDMRFLKEISDRIINISGHSKKRVNYECFY